MAKARINRPRLVPRITYLQNILVFDVHAQIIQGIQSLYPDVRCRVRKVARYEGETAQLPHSVLWRRGRGGHASSTRIVRNKNIDVWILLNPLSTEWADSVEEGVCRLYLMGAERSSVS